MRALFLCVLLLAGPGAPWPARAADLSLTVVNLAPGGQGTLRAALYASAEDFEHKGQPFAALMMRQAEEGVHLSLGPLPPGRYAVRVFQDLNANGTLDTNLLGIPTEPFGFSNDAMGEMGPPSFAAAAITLESAPLAIRVTLRR
ncbi:DUF2141 domain-containing protein [Oleisolibacter albus]|uniref:DUF2141 domain-containing protein n=1 Tax=Oleisolibacter albus TaxID=2171757 RepID=UPI000DF23AD2|nr:DUF2141 domain-containing protein [Oleisolibacter albus]